MTLDRWRIVEQIVGNTLELERPQRPAYLDAVCGADRELRTEVERILAGDSEEFLERPPSLLQDLLDEAGEDWVFEPGEQVAGRFRIVRWLAHGGMGEVYEAEDNELPGVRVALKTVRGHIAWSENLRQQFRREVELARKVTHPNVCRIYDLTRHQKRLSGGGEEDALVLSMELLEGETLSEVLRREGPMPLDAARPIAMGILDALAAAHAAGVMHGDLKPNNIMLVCEQGARRPIVMDFGLAHQVQERGIAGGAPAYMAPEQLTGGQTTAATDIYSFGAIIFEMLTGGQWPREESHGEPPGSGQLDRRWGAVASRCLEREPEARFQSVLEVRQALAAGGGMTRRYVLVGASMLTSAAALFGYRRLAERNSRAIVAVLPFENAGGSPDNRYFIEGLADEIRECLARVPGLRVIARTSSEEAGRSLMSLVGAGERLRASYLVSGSGRRDGQTVALTVRLVDARTGLELWRRDYRKADVDAMSARSDVAATLVPALGFQLRKEVTSQLAPGRTTNTAAFDQYVRARAAADLRGTENLQQALELYRGALELDPNFALAWAGLAECRELLAGRSGYPLIQWMTEARQDAYRAIELCPELPEGLNEIALIRQRFDWDWPGAEDFFKRAIAANPNYVEGHRLYAGLLSNLGRAEESKREIAVAQQLDPLSVLVRNLYAAILYRTGHYQEALEQYQDILRSRPEFRNAYLFLPDTYAQLGRWNEAIEAARQATQRFQGESRFLYTLGFVLAKSGQTAEARNILNKLETRWATERFTPIFPAMIHMALGETDAMFDWLERCWIERDPNLQLLRVDPWLAPYHRDPRFQDLLRRLRLE